MGRRDARGDDAPPFNSPFRDLARRLGPLPERPKASPARGAARGRPPSTAPTPPLRKTRTELFRAAVRGAVPIPPSARDRAAATSTAQRDGKRRSVKTTPLSPSSLISSPASPSFDVSDTDEHVEGMVVGLDPRVLRRLRAGEFAYQAHLDLHGMTAEEAKQAVHEFVLRSMVVGSRCVLIVHGRGRNSPDQRPVLKDRLKHWLTHGELGRRVLAFSSARPYDGGSGAMYVLLRRERRGKKPFRTLDGAKS